MFYRWLSRLLVAGVVAWANASELDREIVLTPHLGSQPEDRAIVRWQELAAKSDACADTLEQLGWAFIAKARATQDAGFYKLAEKTADVADAQFGVTNGSRLLRGHVLHNLHRFREAEILARDLAATRGAPADFALLSDALIEQGKLAEGVEALQRLVALKPGVEAFSRIAHLRWLKGDLDGALNAMEMARRASDARAGEARAWILVRLSGYVLQTGDLSRALQLADDALLGASDYAPALLARGRALLALERLGDALVSLRRAAELNPLPEYQWWLADALRLAGRHEAAAGVEELIKARGAASDPRTLALFLATRGDEPARAVRLASDERDTRADPLTLDALAWAFAATGEWNKAAAAMRLALAENTADARLLLHAATIAAACGEQDSARGHAERARRFAATLTPSERRMLEATLCFQPKT